MVTNREHAQESRARAQEIPIKGVIRGEPRYYTVTPEIVRLLEKLRQLKEEVSTQPTIMRYRRVRKTIDILNQKGDAKISFFFDCRNRQSPMRRLRHFLKYSGAPLSRKDVVVKINGDHLKPELETYGLHKIPGGKTPPFDNSTDLYINPQSPIKPNRAFTYEYTVCLEGVYSKALEKEWTSHAIMHPTNSLELSIRAPSNYQFVKEALNIKVIQYNGLIDVLEIERITNKFKPIFMKDNTEILWEIKNPKITYTYEIYFKISKV
ncbi:hypothetical protein E3J74_06175 [Candidatus Bathyarchaeota archaeon]|nr:MAG: hypothetical protein E3J74_06175 [Candidatus Bathyarchaeota archaeon]